MVSQTAVPLGPSSRQRLLDAAAHEFAARGFDGAKVDRIAARARINKAMVYYHFRSKADLYRAILTELFRSMTAAVSGSRDAAASPEDQVRVYIRTIAARMAARPHYPAIWLREMAEGGRHVDASIVTELGQVLGVLDGILKAGRHQRVFRDANALVTQMGIVGPLLLFAASAPARERFRKVVPGVSPVVPPHAMVAHIETATLAALTAASPRSGRGSARRSPRQ